MKHERMKIDFRQQAEAPSVLDLYIYDEVKPDGFDWWTWEMTQSETSANFFRDKLAEYPDVSQINLYINSVGGSVLEGYGIYAQLRRHPAKVTAYVDGFACSIASVIAMAADHIVMSVGSMMLIHNMLDYCYGNAADHRKTADDLDSMMEGNRQIYLQRTAGKLTEDKLTEMLDAETWLTAQDCMTYGLCDEIAGEVKDPSGLAQRVQAMSSALVQQIQYYRAARQQLSAALDARPAAAELTAPQTPPTPAEKTVSTFLTELAELGKE